MDTRTLAADQPIGVFDSGMGGLTVLRALRAAMPREDFVYLGDTARLPYGTKTAATVQRYALQAAGRLVTLGVKAIVVACNTASATALPAVEAQFPDVPVFGVVEPGAAAAAAHGGTVALLATEGTVRGGAYQRALMRRGVRMVRARAAPLLVALAEEPSAAQHIQAAIIGDYLHGLVQSADTLLLGCTHFPVFVQQIEAQLAGRAVVVDSATTTAAEVAANIAPRAHEDRGEIVLMATDGADRFRRIGARFLGEPIHRVELVDV